MFEDYSERLFAHFVAGRWRVPHATRAISLHRPDGAALGQIVPAGAADVARAANSLRGSEAAARARAAEAVRQAAGTLAAAHALQTGQRIDPHEISRLAGAMVQVFALPTRLVHGAPDTDFSGFGAALGAGLQSGVIWCPPPRWACFATCLAQVLQGVDLPPGAFALLHAQTPETEALLRQAGLLPQ